MTVGILLITHGGIGEELLRTAQTTLEFCPLQTEALSVPQSTRVEEIDAMAEAICMRLNGGEGVLVLTDMYGSTPSNVANRLLKLPYVSVVSGVNLPMLIRVMNYSDLTLPELVIKAVTGGHCGIIQCGEDC